MAHRVKNLFTVASSVVSMSSRSANSADELAAAIKARLESLSRAHQLTLPTELPGAGARRVTLGDVLATLLSPYNGTTVSGERVTMRGCDIAISPSAITSFSLVVHELATNAAKYGALSTDDGHLTLEWEDGEDGLELVWTEHGGPMVEQGDKEGFGTRLINLTIERQFGGEIVRQWNSDGLVIRLHIPKGRMAEPRD